MTRPLAASPGAAAERWRPWAEALPQVTRETLRVAVLRRRLRRRLARLPGTLWERLGRALAELVPADLQPEPRLDLTLVQPDGARRRLTLEAAICAVGRDPGCAIRLPSPSVAARQAEIRLRPTGAELLALSPGLAVDGKAMESDHPLRLAEGMVIDLPPYRLVIGELTGGAAPGAGLEARSVVPLLAATEVARLAPGDPWIRLEHGEWHGLASVPASLIELAARVAGDATGAAGSAVGGGAARPLDEYDHALLAFVLARTVRRVEELTGVRTTFSGPYHAAQAEWLADRDPGGAAWALARIGFELGGTVHESAVIWAEAPAGAGPGGLDAYPAPVTAELGYTVITRHELSSLEPGDVILPDRWHPSAWPPPPADEEDGEIRLRLRLAGGLATRPEEAPSFAGRLHAAADGWRVELIGTATPTADDPSTRPGDVMDPDDMDTSFEENAHPYASADGDATVDATSGSPQRAQLGDDLEVILGFELARLSVPLGELRGWREGDLLPLGRGADEPIRLVLHQPGGHRLLGRGRVVMLDGRLGVVVDAWEGGGAESP